MRMQRDQAAAVKRELRVCTRVLNNPDKYSKSVKALCEMAKQSAENYHGIHAHPRPFQETCAAYENVIAFPQPTRRVEV